MKRRTFMIGAPLAVAAGCSSSIGEDAFAPQSELDRVRYTHPGPSSLTLFTMKNTGSNNGAHSGLMINASERVLWDPAGTFGHPLIPARDDVHFGVNPQIEQLYISFHSRETYYTLIQEVDVPAEVAEMAFQLALANGPTPKAACTRHTSRMLKQLPGFESIRTALFPNNLSDRFAELPGVRSREYRESDSADKSVAAEEIDQVLTAGQ